MVLSATQQIFELVNNSNNILICLPKNPSTDAIASGLALFMALGKKDKKSKVVCSDFNLPPNHSFLPKSKDIHSDLKSLRKFIISLDVSRTKVEELSYDISNNKLNVFITPKDGFFEERDISTSASGFEYDLIFILDSPELESLGGIYDNNTEFFYHTPIINIDHHPTNDHFGQINLVELTATSTSEIVFELLRSLDEKIIDEYIATNLLAGIISKTKSFQAPSITPRSLAIASHLIGSGARRDEIIKNLYRNKSLATLKLWGRVLARLRSDLNNRVIWSLLNQEDFEKSGAQEDDLTGVVDELIINTPEAEVVMLLYKKGKNKINGIVYTLPQINALDIFKDFKTEGTKDFTKITIPGEDLLETEKGVINLVKEYLKK